MPIINSSKELRSIAEEAEGSMNLKECDNCGRRFREEVLLKHKKACAKSTKKRPTFDMSKQRVDEEALQVMSKETKKDATPVKKKMPKWKRDSDLFRAAMKGDTPSTTGNFNPKHDQYSESYDDLKFCNMCTRRYNETAFDKHLAHCERKFKNNQMKSKPGKK